MDDNPSIDRSIATSPTGHALTTPPVGPSRLFVDDDRTRSTEKNDSDGPEKQYALRTDGTSRSKPKVPLSLVIQNQHDSTVSHLSISEVSPRLLSALEQIELLGSRLCTQYREGNSAFGSEIDGRADNWMYNQEHTIEHTIAPVTATTEVEDSDPDPSLLGMRVYSFAAFAAHSPSDTLLGILKSVIEGSGPSPISRDHV